MRTKLTHVQTLKVKNSLEIDTGKAVSIYTYTKYGIWFYVGVITDSGDIVGYVQTQLSIGGVRTRAMGIIHGRCKAALTLDSALKVA